MSRRRVRQLGLGLLGLISTGLVFGSFFVQLLSPAPAAGLAGGSWHQAWCLGGMARLERELQQQFAACAAASMSPAAVARFDAWADDFASRSRSLTAHCQHRPALSAAGAALLQLEAHTRQAVGCLGPQSQPQRQVLHQAVDAAR